MDYGDSKSVVSSFVDVIGSRNAKPPKIDLVISHWKALLGSICYVRGTEQGPSFWDTQAATSGMGVNKGFRRYQTLRFSTTARGIDI